MQFKTKKPTHQMFAVGSYSFESLMLVNTPIIWQTFKGEVKYKPVFSPTLGFK